MALALSLPLATWADPPPPAANASVDRLTFGDPPTDITRAATEGESGNVPAPTEPGDTTLALAISPDGTLLARAGDPPSIEIRQREGNRRVALFSAHSEPVNALAFAPDGTRLASGGFDRVLRLWDVKTGQESLAIPGHDGWIRSLAYAPDGKTLASASQDGHVRVWDAATGQSLADLRGHDGPVRALAWSPDGTRLASAGADRSVIVWDVARRAEAARWSGHVGTVRALAWSPDGKTLASAGEDHLILLRNSRDGHVVHRVAATADQVLCLAYTPHGTGLLAGGYDGSIRVIEAATGKLADTLPGHGEAVAALAVDGKSGRLVSAGLDRTLREWTPAVPVARLLATIETSRGNVARALFTQDGSQLIVSENFSTTERPRSLRYHDPSSGALLRSVELPLPGTFAEFAAGGRRLLTRNRDGRLGVWDVETRTEVANLDGVASWRAGGAATLSPDSHTLAAGLTDGSVGLWTDKPTPRHSTLASAITGGRPPTVRGLAFSPDGAHLLATYLVVDPEEGSVRLRHAVWDLPSGQPRLLPEPSDIRSSEALWSPDGTRIAVYVSPTVPGFGPRLAFFDAATGAASGTFNLPGTTLSGLAWHPGGRRLTIATAKGSLMIWDLEKQAPLGTIRVSDRPSIMAVFDPQGRRLATCAQNVVKVWALGDEDDQAARQPTREQP